MRTMVFCRVGPGGFSSSGKNVNDLKHLLLFYKEVHICMKMFRFYL